jgi:hypothetical protein
MPRAATNDTQAPTYWLLHELRGAAPKRSIWRTATFETIRCTFLILKIAVRIQDLPARSMRLLDRLFLWQAARQV